MDWPESWRDLYFPKEELQSLSREEKEYFENVFIKRLGSWRLVWYDQRPIKALGVLKSIKASEKLKSLLNSLRAHLDKNIVVCAAEALWEIEKYQDSSKIIAGVLDSTVGWTTRINAALGLRNFDDNLSFEALMKAVRSDKDRLVRYNAVRSIFFRLGADPDKLPPDLLFKEFLDGWDSERPLLIEKIKKMALEKNKA